VAVFDSARGDCVSVSATFRYFSPESGHLELGEPNISAASK